MPFPAVFELSSLNGTNGFTINGINAFDFSGKSVSSAGDVNGDGFDDIIIGAFRVDLNGSYSGQSYVVFGGDEGFSANLELSTLNGTNGFTINGININDRSGGSVSNAGDINGDGFDDLLIGTPNANPNGEQSGQSYVVFGGDEGFSASLELSTLNGTNGFAINGIDIYDYSSRSVSSAGDVNGDGFDDLIIGAPLADPNGISSGQSYVVFGRSGNFSASLDLSTLNGTNGFAINGINAHDFSGSSVSSARDVNGDGFDDLIIGAPLADPNGSSSGQSYVVFGRNGDFGASLNLSTLDGTNGFAINGIKRYDGSGSSVSSAGDINGDGFNDLLIGARDTDPYGNQSGLSYVVLGHSGSFDASLNLSTLNGTNGFALINAIDVYEYSSVSFSSAGDVNGDGFDDLIISASEADPDDDRYEAGQSYVVFGEGGGFSASLDLSILNGTNGFVLNGINADDRSGSSVSSAGDVNGDGFDDIIIGASYADPNGDRSGQSYVVFGRGGTGSPLPSITLAVSLNSVTEDGTTNLTYTFTRIGNLINPLTVSYTIDGTATNGIDYETISTSVTFAANSATATVTVNPTTDIIIEADETVSLTLTSDTGYIIETTTPITGTILNDDGLIFGRRLELSSLNGTNGFTINGINAFDFSGSSVSSAGDVNGDGFDDIIIGASYANPNGIDSGQSYVVFGGGGGFGASLNLSSLDGTNGFAINGINAYDLSGSSVSSAGDVNGDGFDDIIIGARRARSNGASLGQSYVVFGGGGGFGASLELSTLDGTNGFAINGINASSVSSAKDINGDGFDDLIIGASGARPNGDQSGQSYVVFGRSGGFSASLELSTLDGTNGFTINGINVYDGSGTSVSSAGDINGDGFDDLIIGAPGADPNGTGSGQSYVVFGGSGGFSASLELSTLDGTNGFAINGIDDYDLSGGSVSSAGDVNGDEFDDLIIGAGNADPNGDRIYVVFGRSGGFDASFNLSTLDGTNGFALNVINAVDFSDISLSSAGDINGDGFDDIIIGAWGADPNGIYEAGQSYVLFGRSRDFSASLDLSTLNGSDGFTINGINADDGSGTSVSSAGDVNGDGFDDIIIGARGANPNGESSGQSYVVFGRGTPSSITLAVSPSSVPEDGTANLIYTFTRTGSLTNPLTVNYSIGGTATNGIDYETIGTSVTFAANSATATVTINPIDDTVVESNNKTVVLTLVANPAYNIGTISAVTGTIVEFANFDPAQYGASNPDLIPVFSDNLDALRQYYLDFGRFEGRSTDDFDEFRYIASNPDLITFYGSNGAGATEHYLRYGFDEGRFLTSFDPAQYLASNGDLINVYGYNLSEATLHYIQYGFNDDRPIDAFAETSYIASYDDLTRYYGYNPQRGTEHYILSGYDEIQAGTRSQPSFDPALYLATYTDLIQSVNQQFAEPNTGAFVDNYGSVLEFGNFHFITYGINENRSRLGFDPNSYLNRNPDLQAAFGNDLLAATRHYIEFGFEEERITL